MRNLWSGSGVTVYIIKPLTEYLGNSMRAPAASSSKSSWRPTRWSITSVRSESYPSMVSSTTRGAASACHTAIPERLPRVSRSGDTLYIYSSDLRALLASHNVSWSRRDSFCDGQYEKFIPEEQPTPPVKTQILQFPKAPSDKSFAKFDFDAEDTVWMRLHLRRSQRRQKYLSWISPPRNLPPT